MTQLPHFTWNNIPFQWQAMFPTDQTTEVQSAIFVKKLLAIAVSNITYLRGIFPERAFADRCLEGARLCFPSSRGNCVKLQ